MEEECLGCYGEGCKHCTPIDYKIINHNKILSLIEECRKHPKDLLDKLEEIRRLVNERT